MYRPNTTLEHLPKLMTFGNATNLLSKTSFLQWQKKAQPGFNTAIMQSAAGKPLSCWQISFHSYSRQLVTAEEQLWQHCWLGVRKSNWPVKNSVIRCWHGYLSGKMCKWFAYGPADATAAPSSLASLKSRLV